ncbi:receptor-like protein 6 [Quercus suber]|uniref:receptor-like protein 6 n=1 Tax=Quercus suber TaxID=58331 RepID=UPI000CE2829F|nr:receptor-like protein 12 [Quercus suber]
MRLALSYMFLSSIFLFSLFHLSTESSSSIRPLCHNDERSALLQFKESFIANHSTCFVPYAYPYRVASWTLRGENSSCCSWDGVDCDEGSGHVIGLNLSNSCLYGSINSSSSLFHLVHLQVLDLSYNHFNYSHIPSTIGNLSMLTHLNLSYSFFVGQIPSEISLLNKLSFLDLSYNYLPYSSPLLGLELKIPNLKSLIQNLTNLEKLHLRMVDISSPPVPNQLANMTSLTSLALSSCGLVGEFPMHILQLPNLQMLELSNNSDLIGYFPESHLSSHLKYLCVKRTRFSGEIPASIGNLVSLEYLDFTHCNLSGLIPPSLGNLSMLTSLYLSGNHFMGQLPSSFSNLTKLTSLLLFSCGLVGEFPKGILQLPNLQFLELFNNSDLVGYFPESHLSSHLKYLCVGNTRFSGKIPASIGNLASLEYLDFTYCNLSGLVPPSLGNLSMLTYLYLSGNNFWGQLPFSLSNLTKLTHLGIISSNLSNASWSLLSELNKITFLLLGGNNLTGGIPHFLANFTQLTYLYLDSNLFTGHVPFWVMNLTKLNCLDLSENMLQGSIPSSISQLENLQNLDLFSNNLSGTVELDMLLGLKNLTQLCLSFNRLSLLPKKSSNATLQKFYVLGLASCNLNEFPKFLQNQEGLTYLDLAFNNIHGQIPQWFWKTSTETLEFLDLSHNFLTSSNQSLFILHWSHLLVLNISSNRFQGSLPIPPPSISFYSISINELSGEIPPQICNLNFLEVLDLSENNLSGNVPKCLGNFSNSLTILNLRRNNLNGTIPHTWTSGNKLRMINLGENKLSGQVPKSIVNCAMLEILDLGSNQINDTFPFWFGNLPELKVLILRSNGFYGVIASPEFNLAFPKLRVIDVSCNSLTGSLPSKFFQSWNAMKIVGKGHLSYMQVETRSFVRGFPDHYDYSMTVTNKGLTMKYDKIIEVYTIIDFSQNRFAGEIPESIATLKGLHTLNLSNNMFTGHIPSSIANLTQLESMDLSQNKISGEIPQQLLQLTFLESFDVSYNNLTGSIPQGNQFDTFPKSSFEGNSGLCGSQLSRKCEGFSPSISNENQGHGSSIEIDWKFVVIGYGSGFLVGFVIGQIMTTRKPNWFVNTLGIMQQKRKRQTWRGCRN